MERINRKHQSHRPLRIPAIFFFLLMMAGIYRIEVTAAETNLFGTSWEKPDVYPPTALSGEGGTKAVYLSWNPNLEEDLSGYRVYRRAPGSQDFEEVKDQLYRQPFCKIGHPENGVSYEYAVKAVLRDGEESEFSNAVTLTSRETQSPVIEEGDFEFEVPGYEDAFEVEKGLKIRFENGHQLIFDKNLARVRDWQSDKGQHLIYPVSYGNPIDIARMNDNGVSDPLPATAERAIVAETINLNYSDHDRKRRAWYVGYETEGNNVTIHYRIPLSGPGIPKGSNWDLWIWADIWETWGPSGKDIHGTDYQGLSRKIELKIPDYYDKGYSVCLNDGFGLDGSCAGALTYQLRWEKPHLSRIKWQKGMDMKEMDEIRADRGFHPTDWATQVNPFIYAHFYEGTMLIAPEKYYHATTYGLTNYAGQGHDGIWPNYKVDCHESGQRYEVETFHYLWTDDTSLKPPQLYMDAAFHFRRNLASLYQVNPHMNTMDYGWGYWGPDQNEIEGKPLEEQYEILVAWGEERAKEAEAANIEVVGGAHTLWTSSPYLVSDEIRLDPNHPMNEAIAEMTGKMAERGIDFTYWVRPEFVKTATPNVLSGSFPTNYYGYVRQLYPSGKDIVEDHGITLIRNHPEWIRTDVNGEYFESTPYNWTPMSLTRPDGWYDKVVYPMLEMMREMGYDFVLQDGGFSCLTGVDYTGGKARSVQPYYWRFYYDLNRMGIHVAGECMLGWGNNGLGGIVEKDMDYSWAYTHCLHDGRSRRHPWFTPALHHRAHQLYTGTYMRLNSDEDDARVAQFANEFVAENGHPDRVYLEGLEFNDKEQKWTWNEVWWEYADGKRVRYPDYEEIR